MITRNFYISLLVFNGILFSGGWLLRESEAGVQAVVVAGRLERGTGSARSARDTEIDH